MSGITPFSSSSSLSGLEFEFDELTFRATEEKSRSSFSAETTSSSSEEVHNSAATLQKTSTLVSRWVNQIHADVDDAKTEFAAGIVLEDLKEVEERNIFEEHPTERLQVYAYVIQRLYHNKTNENKLLEKAREVYNQAQERGVWVGHETERLSLADLLKV